MWISYIALIFFVSLTGYFFVFPLSKKRVVLIKEGGLILYLIILVATPSQFLEVWTLVLAATITLFLYLMKPWFIYGATGGMLHKALGKAALATRSPLEKVESGYKINGSIRVKLYKVAQKTTLLSFREINESKKAQLTKVVFKKFIQNYFI